MNDLRARLERIGERIDPRPGAFERLERARRRRERNRRIAAGVVAFAVAIAGSLAWLTAFRDSEPRPGVGVEDGFFALWPESTYEGALAEQDAIDQGALSRRAWRLDAVATAEEFARSTLGWGWDNPDEDLIHVDVADDVGAAGPGPVTLGVSLPRHGPGSTALFASVTLARLVRPDGIWSVVEVGGDAFDLRLDPGQQVALGESVAVPTTLEEGTGVAVGVAGTGSCSGFHEQTAEVVEGHIVVPVGGVGEGCDGYLYALTPSTPVGQVELGRIMFVYGEPKPALGYTIESIAAVPVRFVAPGEGPPSGTPSPEVLRVSCDRRTIEASSEAMALPAGIHAVVENTSGAPLFFQFAPSRTGPWGGTELQPGSTELALQAPPGIMTIKCWADGEATDEIQVDVRDPQGLFVPGDLACPGEPVLASTISSAPWHDTEESPEPIEFVRSRIDGLLPSDVVERAGYPGPPTPAVRLMRDGAVVGSFELFLENGEWRVGGSWCGGLGITVVAGPDPYPRGVFDWCPEGPFAEPGVQWEQAATAAATVFVQAYVSGDQASVAGVLDNSVPAGASFPVSLATDAVSMKAPNAVGDRLVRFACGPDVDANTVAITIDDGTDSASLDFTVYLVFRGPDGWKVWGVY